MENSGGNADAGATGPEHACQKVMGKRQNGGTCPVMAHEQPTCKALLDLVKPIAGGDLRCSQRLEVHVTV